MKSSYRLRLLPHLVPALKFVVHLPLSCKEEKKKAEKKKASAAKTAKNARVKKIKTQLEGLDLVEKVVMELMSVGLGTIGGASIKTYQELAKQMGDYYLPGPQRLCSQLLIDLPLHLPSPAFFHAFSGYPLEFHKCQTPFLPTSHTSMPNYACKETACLGKNSDILDCSRLCSLLM